ncbi:hypothetical protein L1987_05737 [Smallanthus sonchifolius]|uniref:Uncharacterized protein n=1 Tax=Smallanthus sonchifolius TaxID=185202 RepID=A0ACB9JWK6_9ASTR|nr:hypothetical protein L1987_05737 [Smallanthus sonchifolius]
MIHAGVCSVFVKILKDGPMKVQAVVAWAVSELVLHYLKCGDVFLKHGIVRLLVGHLAFETVEEHSKMHNVVTSTIAMKNQSKPTNSNQKTEIRIVKKQNHHHRNHYHGRELEDPATKAYMKAMAARALWHLAIGNSAICRSITESRALLCFAVLLDKGPKDVQYNSAMALKEITSVAEQDPELKRSAFKPNSPACKAITEQLVKIVQKPDSKLLLPCVKAIGNLARTFRATECQIIQPLVQLLDEREAEVTEAAAVALTKFACSENYLHLDHSKVIISYGGAKHLIQLVYFGEQMVQTPALVLLCYITQHVPDSKVLAHAEVLTTLEWASKQSMLIHDESVESLLQNSTSRLELYQSRGSWGFH